jgi:hypothetical protein
MKKILGGKFKIGFMNSEREIEKLNMEWRKIHK